MTPQERQLVDDLFDRLAKLTALARLRDENRAPQRCLSRALSATATTASSWASASNSIPASTLRHWEGDRGRPGLPVLRANRRCDRRRRWTRRSRR